MDFPGQLLCAAQYIENGGLVAEHCYATPETTHTGAQTPVTAAEATALRNGSSRPRSRGCISSSSRGSSNYLRQRCPRPEGQRSTHNEAEKQRRAQMRLSLERLKAVVPPERGAGRHTSVAEVLKRATLLIQYLESKNTECGEVKEALLRRQKELEWRWAALIARVQSSEETAAAAAAEGFSLSVITHRQCRQQAQDSAVDEYSSPWPSPLSLSSQCEGDSDVGSVIDVEVETHEVGEAPP